MNYYINPTSLSSVFTVPCQVVDSHIRLAGENQLKVLLFVLRNSTSAIDSAVIARETGVPVSEAEDALLYWTQCGMLKSDFPQPEPAPQQREVPVRRIEKPNRTDVARRGSEDAKIALLLREAQMKFGRNLKTNESSTLVWLYDDEGMDISVILILIHYALSKERCNIGFIEKTALEWLADGVESVADAERHIAETAKKELAWSITEKAFGIERRRPSARELEYSNLWINEWGLSAELLRAAYDACVDSKAKLSVPYIAKILESWHSKGYKAPQDIKKEQKPRKTEKQCVPAYDLELFEKMLNSDDD